MPCSFSLNLLCNVYLFVFSLFPTFFLYKISSFVHGRLQKRAWSFPKIELQLCYFMLFFHNSQINCCFITIYIRLWRFQRIVCLRSGWPQKWLRIPMYRLHPLIYTHTRAQVSQYFILQLFTVYCVLI